MGKKLNANKVRQETAHKYTERIRELEDEVRSLKLEKLENEQRLKDYRNLDAEYAKLRFFLGLDEKTIRRILSEINLEQALGASLGLLTKPLFSVITGSDELKVNSEYIAIWKEIFGGAK